MKTYCKATIDSTTKTIVNIITSDKKIPEDTVINSSTTTIVTTQEFDIDGDTFIRAKDALDNLDISLKEEDVDGFIIEVKIDSRIPISTINRKIRVVNKDSTPKIGEAPIPNNISKETP